MRIIFAVLILAISGCATEGRFITVEKDGWYNVENWPMSTHGELAYCQAHAPSSSDATPTCYRPQYMERTAPAPRAPAAQSAPAADASPREPAQAPAHAPRVHWFGG